MLLINHFEIVFEDEGTLVLTVISCLMKKTRFHFGINNIVILKTNETNLLITEVL